MSSVVHTTSSRPCVICQAPARSVNYGVVTCNPCKSFFLRANQGGAHKTYRCVNGFSCDIDIDSRKSCSYCRFQRCLSSGMTFHTPKAEKKKLSHTAKTRNKLSVPGQQKDDLEQAAQDLLEELTALTASRLPAIGDKGHHFSMMEKFELDTLWSKYSYCFYNIPVVEEAKNKCRAKSRERSFSVVSSVISRLFFFTNSVPQFMELSQDVRKELFGSSCSELCLVNASLAFDKQSRTWLTPMNQYSRFYQGVPSLDTEDLVELLGSKEVYENMVSLATRFQNYRPDEMVTMLLFVILLFTPRTLGRAGGEVTEKYKLHYLSLLHKYLTWRFGNSDGNRVFRDLTMCLKEFRRIGQIVHSKIHGPVMLQSGILS